MIVRFGVGCYVVISRFVGVLLSDWSLCRALLCDWSLIGRALSCDWPSREWGVVGNGRCFVVIGRAEKGRGQVWGCFAVNGRAEKWAEDPQVQCSLLRFHLT